MKKKAKSIVTLVCLLMLAALGVATLMQSTTSAQSTALLRSEDATAPTLLLEARSNKGRSSNVGAVYVNDNSTPRNAVTIFHRRADGSLVRAGRVATGGRGTGNLLEAQGSLVLSEGNEWLFAVNAGSDEISVFAVVEGDGLVLVDKVPSGGDRPISLSVSEDLLYVLNAGSEGNITGFTINPKGRLTPLEGSTRRLSTTEVETCPFLFRDLDEPNSLCSVAGPAQVQFSPGADGVGPVGFDIAKRNRVVVSNGFLDAPGQGGAASYLVSGTGIVNTVTGNVPNGQTASCWVIITNDGRYAYVFNPVSATITSYTIQDDGGISLLNLVGGDVSGGDPRDPALSMNGRYLYVLNNRTATISSFLVRGDGSLVRLDLRAGRGFPSGAVGLAAH
ncbi:MAG: lactonase family protein [Acidobacteria bacterium]|nr:lactonase family protein [Acidobacteriota bacterium]